MRKTATYVCVGFALLSGTVAYATLSGDGGGRDARAVVAAGKDSSKLAVSGHVSKLYPGAKRPLMVQVRNRYPDVIRLRLIVIRVDDAGPDCTSENLRVRRRRATTVTVQPDGRRVVRVSVRMRGDAPDACQDARWPLRFTARGTRL